MDSRKSLWVKSTSGHILEKILLGLIMAAFWRQVGLNYVQFSSICARVVRHCLKPQYRAEAIKKDETHLKITKWSEGKPVVEAK